VKSETGQWVVDPTKYWRPENQNTAALLNCTFFSLNFLSKLFTVKDEDEEYNGNDDGNMEWVAF
jgi:hypothetical protein